MNLPSGFNICPRCNSAHRPGDCRGFKDLSHPLATSPQQREPSEHQTKWQKGEEGKFHRAFAQDLDRRGVLYIHSIFGRKSTVDMPGCPDFVCLYNGKTACVELKADGGTLKQDQKDFIYRLEAQKIPV